MSLGHADYIPKEYIDQFTHIHALVKKFANLPKVCH
jgi:hypothetical protein